MQRTLKIIEPVMLALVPAVLALCAFFHVENAALLSLLVAVAALGPFFLRYELQKPRPRDMMPIVVLSAIAAAGRLLFEPFPNFKPVSALVIFTGVYFGRQGGFLCGALAALVSNMFFGQGPWTPWQMYAWGLMGYLAGALQQTPLFRRRVFVYAYGALASLLFGVLMDTWYVIGFLDEAAPAAIGATYAAGLPMNLIHAASTVVFLAAILAPWGAKIARVKQKYGIRAFE